MKLYKALISLLYSILIISIFSQCGSYNKRESLVASKTDSLPEYVDFNLHIKPILSDRCFACHGPDGNNRKGNLRLDTKEGIFAALGENKDHYSIVPGDPNSSELYKRLITSNKDEVMPIPASNLYVSDLEIALIKKWIEQGAEWKQHWSLIPAKKPAIPKIKNTRWPVNPIDNFILAKLEKENIKPSKEASKETLIKRVSLDLTGMLPTIQELDAFLADKSPKSYENLVDRLLASQAYGERMAADWMDVARFADSQGYQDDGYRNSWHWRDWVIKAFNENMPFDKFTTWQIAGDLLPNATKEQRLATGFNRNHPQSMEGGIVDEEYRVEYVLDRVNTTSKAFLGLTMECSRCHDHKYDPLTQKEYYQFSAFFNQVDEAGQVAYNGVAPPSMLLTDEVMDKKLAFIDEKIKAKENELKNIEATANNDFSVWHKSVAEKVKLSDIPFGLVAHFPLDDTYPAQSPNDKKEVKRNYPEKPSTTKRERILVTTEMEPISGKPLDFKPAVQEKKKTEPKKKKPEPKKVVMAADTIIPNDFNITKPGKVFSAVTFAEGKVDKAFYFKPESILYFNNDLADFERTDPFSFSLWAMPGKVAEKQTLISKMPYGNTGYDIYLNKDKITTRLISMWPTNVIMVTTKKSVKLSEWNHIAVTYDGSSKAAGLKIFINGEEAEVLVEKDNLYKTIRLNEPTFKFGEGYTGGKMDEVFIFNRELTSIEVKGLAGKKSMDASIKYSPDALSSEEQKALYAYYLHNYSQPYKQKLTELQKLREEQNALIMPVEQTMVLQDVKIPRETFLLIRGAYDAHGEKVDIGTPRSVMSFPKKYPRNRLGLAQWLTDSKNPLVSRVNVNRYWQQYFGTGIVSSSDDFGSQGTLPTHPELLDWLAVRFIESSWDIKAMQKLIVMSATYRQASKLSPELLAKDPQNVLYARGPRQRLSFEMVRDNALVASNLLVKKIGGPSVKPYQPEGLWEEKTSGRLLTFYQQDHGDSLYRRSLYTFFKRTSPPPTMMTFDAPERASCYVRRRNTNTPLQALVTLNDQQFIEASRVLAERMIKEGGQGLEKQITFAFRASLSRFPTKNEIAILSSLYNKEINRLKNDEKSAGKLLSIGERKADLKLDKIALAANTIVATTILNMDEAVTKQ